MRSSVSSKLSLSYSVLGIILFLCTSTASAMHVSEGILTVKWAFLWYLLVIPFIVWGLIILRKKSSIDPLFKPTIALVGASVFVFSCLPIPIPVAGTCSHPVGTGLASIIIGAPLTVVISSIALLLQALFLAHGGLTTLGANVFSMGVVGGFCGFAAFKLCRRSGVSLPLSAFAAGLISDWATYSSTSVVLALGLQSHEGSFWNLFFTILIAFMPTQIPLGILEGIISAIAINFIYARRPAILQTAGKEIIV